MALVACESKLRCAIVDRRIHALESCLSIGRVVVYCDRAFSAKNKCQHCIGVRHLFNQVHFNFNRFPLFDPTIGKIVISNVKVLVQLYLKKIVFLRVNHNF